MKNQKKLIACVLYFLLGLMIILQIKAVQTGYKHFAFHELYQQTTLLESEKHQLEQLRQRKEKLSEEIELFTKAVEEEQHVYQNFLEREIEISKKQAGLTPLVGNGVIVLITDGTRELIENENPNHLIVHDVDVRRIVDDLRNAGAEAISINGERVLFNHSKIVCTGPTIQVNHQVFAPPYIIKAIGDTTFLQAAMNAPGSYNENLRQWGLFVEVNTALNIKVPAYSPFYK